MYDPITFDALMNEFQFSLKTQTYKQIEYFKYLCSDYFNLDELINISQNNLNGIQNVRALQKQLYDIHINNYALNNLSQIFQITLDFYNFSRKKLKKQQDQNQKQYAFQEQVFSPQCCSVYCSLIGQSIDVKRVSKNFEQIFEMEQISIIGKDTSYLLPKVLHDAHKLSVNEFINFGNIDCVLNQGERFTFALNGKGFIFPINIRIKTEKFSNDFGVTTLIKKIQDSKHYIIFNESFQITDISSFIYEKIFSEDYSLNELKDKLVCYFIPLLGQIQENKALLQTEDEENLYQTCLLLKKTYKKNQKLAKLQTFIQKTIQNEDRIFSLVFKIRSLQSKHMKHIKYLEIEEFTEQKSILDKKTQLNLLSRHLNIDFIFQEDEIGQKNNENNSEIQDYSPIKDDIFQILSLDNQKIFGKNEEFINNSKLEQNNNLENYTQLNVCSKFSNINTNEIGREENINTERINSQYKYLQNNSALKQSQQELQSEILSSKHEINSFQYLFNQSNRFLIPNSRQNQSNINCFSSSTLDKSQDFSSLKQKSIYTNQLHQKSLNIYQQSNINVNNTINCQNINYKPFIISSFNQSQAEKSSDSNQSISQKNKQIRNQVQANIRDEEFSINKSQYIKKQILKNNSNNYVKKQKKIIPINEEDQYYKNSFNGNKSTQLSLRKRITNKITQNQNTQIIRIIIFTGLTSIIFLQASVLAFYFLNKNNLDSISNLFKKFNSATIINESVFQFTKEQSFSIIAFNFQNVLNLNRLMVDPSDPSKNITELAFRQNISKNQSINAVKQFSKNINNILQSRDEEFFKYISETKIQTMSDFYDHTIYTHQVANNTILYTMLLFQSCLNQLYLQGIKGEYYPESVVFGNIQVFNSAVSQIQVMINDQLINQYENLKQTQLEQLIQILVSGICLVIIAVPFLIYFKSQQYQIIKLLGSFPPSLLQYYINILTIYSSYLEQFEKKENQNKIKSQQFDLKQTMKSISTNHLLQVFDSQIQQQESFETGFEPDRNFALKKNEGKSI
ncbi:transmembrane protein, putative (macronuclear) [Tetrahymena thermophila SB210]|uniref:Transmembrane protein, putative n=1 Tax=Tetrahymena thermophila (strain SB210) TaxID=312017 RepID=W7X2N8_TETTS|nr:transmembrane protein, putative [Tetrahymena thermophila SB210]EWS73535.1 transmembrane protein, putative [Tetrahymena thermophila SB210]|eukprot:XP_012653925.1 transmembrane protein, putative [Tetrahymena thermophila SB210]